MRTVCDPLAMAEAARAFFLAFYAIALLILAFKTVQMLSARPPAERQASGAQRFLPAILIPLQFAVPVLAILFRIGELHADWPLVRACGLALGVYAAGIQLWASATLGRFLVPRAVVFSDHTLVTAGPYRLVRHPIYSGNVALLLGSALGTLNVLILALCPIVAFGMIAEAQIEEGLLEAKFGAEYREYARRTGRLVPRLATLGRP